MPSIDDFGGGDYLKAADFPRGQGHAQALTISEFEIAKFDEGDKLVLHFREREGGVVMNKINLRVVADSYGKDYTQWRGCEVMVYNDPTVADPRGNVVGGIRMFGSEVAKQDANGKGESLGVIHKRLVDHARAEGDEDTAGILLSQAETMAQQKIITAEELAAIKEAS